MLKKIACLSLSALVLGGMWNWTRVVAASERVRDAWIDSQQHQTMEDWELHFSRQVRSMRTKVETMERQARGEALAAEVARLRAERIGKTAQRSAALIASFKSQIDGADAGFVFAGQSYDRTLAGAQLERFENELTVLNKRAESAKAKAEAHVRADAQYRKAADALRAQVLKLEQRGRELALRRQMLENQRRIQQLEARQADVEVDDAPLAELQQLIDVAENALDEVEARQRIDARKRPVKTRSLSESLAGDPTY